MWGDRICKLALREVKQGLQPRIDETRPNTTLGYFPHLNCFSVLSAFPSWTLICPDLRIIFSYLFLAVLGVGRILRLAYPRALPPVSYKTPPQAIEPNIIPFQQHSLLRQVS
jgi:hypothetical protein